MAYEMREGQGSLFRNDKNANSANAPEWSGKMMLDGKIYRVVGWDKEKRDGEKYLSLKGEPADGMRRDERPMKDQLDDSIPF